MIHRERPSATVLPGRGLSLLAYPSGQARPGAYSGPMRRLAILAAVLLSACAQGAAPTPIIVAVTPAAGLPSAAASSPVGGLGVDYAAFLVHLNTSQAQEQTDLNAVEDAYAAGGFTAAEGPANVYLGWSTVELAWLAANAPRSCFMAPWADWKATLMTYRSAMNAFLAHDGVIAQAKIQAGTASLNRWSSDLARVSCD
jgi:hypothetical protein